jgi:hypothetical protein
VDPLYCEKKRQEQRDKEKEPQRRTADPTGDYDKKEPMEPEISNNDDTGKRYLIQADTVEQSAANP